MVGQVYNDDGPYTVPISYTLAEQGIDASITYGVRPGECADGSVPESCYYWYHYLIGGALFLALALGAAAAVLYDKKVKFTGLTQILGQL